MELPIFSVRPSETLDEEEEEEEDDDDDDDEEPKREFRYVGFTESLDLLPLAFSLIT